MYFNMGDMDDFTGLENFGFIGADAVYTAPDDCEGWQARIVKNQNLIATSKDKNRVSKSKTNVKTLTKSLNKCLEGRGLPPVDVSYTASAEEQAIATAQTTPVTALKPLVSQASTLLPASIKTDVANLLPFLQAAAGQAQTQIPGVPTSTPAPEQKILGMNKNLAIGIGVAVVAIAALLVLTPKRKGPGA